MGKLEQGSLFGKYRIVRPIGRGAMGAVYLAEDQTLGRQIALKVLDPRLTSALRFQDVFCQEARTVAGLDHPHIVRIHALESIAGELAIDMAYVEGGSFAEADPSTLYAVRCAADALDALACCHAAGVIHRDVKPSNILLARDGRALLSDFGLARLLSTQFAEAMACMASSSLFVGTPRYAPPEAWDGEEPTPAWDVYSLGMVLYEAIAGHLPYDANTPLALLKQMMQRPVPPLDTVVTGLSPELSSAVAAMIQVRQEDRPRDGQAALELLVSTPEGQAAHENVRASTVISRRRLMGFTRRAKRGLAVRVSPSIRRRTAWGVAVVAIAALAAISLWIEWPSAPPAAVASQSPVPAQPIDKAPFVIWDSLEPQGPKMQAGRWLMLPGFAEGQWEMLAAGDLDVCYMTARAHEDGRWVFEGFWARYADAGARGFRHGSLSGTGRWVIPQVEMAISLELRAQSGTREIQACLLRRSAPGETDTDFLARFESGTAAQALLYNELAPRGLAWADTIESCFLRKGAARVNVPALQQASEPMAMDGRLDEATWRGSLPSGDAPAGQIEALPQGTGGTLLLRCGKKGLYLGFDIPNALETPQFAITLAPRIGVPASQSARWAVLVDQSGLLDAQHTLGDEELPWACAWQSAVGVDPNATRAEMFIPFSDLGLDGPPEPGERWRMNCSVSSGRRSGDSPTSIWGATEIQRVERGLILVFGR